MQETFTAAITEPFRSRTGTASDRSPSSNSWSTMAYPDSSVVSRTARTASAPVSVCGVSGRSPALPSRAARSVGGSPASSTRPIDVAYAGKRVPTVMFTLMMRPAATRAT